MLVPRKGRWNESFTVSYRILYNTILPLSGRACLGYLVHWSLVLEPECEAGPGLHRQPRVHGGRGGEGGVRGLAADRVAVHGRGDGEAEAGHRHGLEAGQRPHAARHRGLATHGGAVTEPGQLGLGPRPLAENWQSCNVNQSMSL